MHFTNPFSFVLMFLSIISIAAPLSPPANNVVRSVRNVSDVRQLDIIVELGIEILNGIVNDIIDISSHVHEVEGSFTQQMVQSLMQKYPGKNVLIFHNQDSIIALSADAVHSHFELGTVLSFTKGYEIWVFDYGTFSLAGDGGYENWAIGGCFSGPRTAVIFAECS